MDNLNEQITIGKRLKQITAKVRSEKEIENFTKVLMDAAEDGKSRVVFTDLRQYLNSLIMAGTVWDWLKTQELGVSGSINQNTGAYEFTIFWE